MKTTGNVTKQGKDQTTVDQSHTSTQTILLQSHQLGHVILSVITQHTHTTFKKI